jgi:hypothetical protein
VNSLIACTVDRIKAAVCADGNPQQPSIWFSRYTRHLQRQAYHRVDRRCGQICECLTISTPKGISDFPHWNDIWIFCREGGQLDFLGEFISGESRTHLRLSLPCGAHTASVQRNLCEKTVAERGGHHYARGDGSGIDFPFDSTTEWMLLRWCCFWGLFPQF